MVKRYREVLNLWRPGTVLIWIGFIFDAVSPLESFTLTN